MAYCSKCGNKLSEGVRFCTQCGAPVAGVANAQAPSAQANGAPAKTPSSQPQINPGTNASNPCDDNKPLMCIVCCGKTTFNIRTLYIYQSRIALIAQNGQVIFNESYSNVVRLRKNQSWLFPYTMFLELKNGLTHKFIPDKYYNLEGRYVGRFNLNFGKRLKTVPDYVNNLIAQYNNKKENLI